MALIISTKTSDLLPYIMPKVPTVPQPFAEFQARLAAIEFCERTRCWRQIITVTLSANGRALIAPAFATIHEFEEATLDGQPLEPTQFIDVDPEEVTGIANDGQAKYIAQVRPGEVAVYPFQAGTLRVSCFLKPRHGQSIGFDAENPLSDAYNVMPDFMVTQYAAIIADGALYRIMSTPSQDFTNMEMAGIHKMAFDAGCNNHFGSNMRGQQRAPIRVKPRWM